MNSRQFTGPLWDSEGGVDAGLVLLWETFSTQLSTEVWLGPTSQEDVCVRVCVGGGGRNRFTRPMQPHPHPPTPSTRSQPRRWVRHVYPISGPDQTAADFATSSQRHGSKMKLAESMVRRQRSGHCSTPFVRLIPHKT